MAGDDFSQLLGQLKERSGLSYGVLGKRLHTSTSTLHRYVNGEAVPTDYAPVERFARACGASREELVELHRRWVLADALRGRKPAGESGRAGEAGAPSAASASTSTSVAGAAAASAPDEVRDGDGDEGGADEQKGGGGESAFGAEAERVGAAQAPVARRRRTVVIVGTAVAAAVASVVLLTSLLPGKGGDDEDAKRSVGAATESVDQSPGAEESADAKRRSASPSASRSPSRRGSPSPSASRTRSDGAAQGLGPLDGASAPSVAINPYKYADPCGPHILVDRNAEQVPPPPDENKARGWITALGGVTGGQQLLALTLQGTGKATVVLNDLHVRVVEKSAPLEWNDYTMGVGCGGGVDTKAFDVALDAGQPTVSPRAGQRDFPYKVSESDPEVFYIYADARAYNVSWYLELDWSSGVKEGTLRIDDNGKPFRTSGNVGRPAYDYPLGDSQWRRNEYDPEIPG